MKCFFFWAFIFFSAFSVQQIYSQSSILERIDAIETSFSFTSEEVPLTVVSQHILKLPIRSSSRTDPSIVSHGEAYFLEIELHSKIEQKSGRRLLDPPYVLRFYSDRGVLLGRVPTSALEVFHSDESNETPPRFIRINIQSIPFTMLERTSRIDIVEMVR